MERCLGKNQSINNIHLKDFFKKKVVSYTKTVVYYKNKINIGEQKCKRVS